MTTFINLDISKKTKVTDYGFQVNESPLPTIYFLLYDEHYVIDYSKFKTLRLLIEKDISKSTQTFSLKDSDLVTMDGFTYVKWNVPAILLDKMDKLNITCIVNYNDESVTLNQFSLIVYTILESETSMIKVAIQNFNKMYQNYLTSVKRTEVGQPLGVVPLTEEGKIKLEYFNENFINHIGDTIYDTIYTIPQIHGLRINRENYEWEYYHDSDQEWYTVNSIHGGIFGYENNESPKYNVFGGLFTDVEAEALDGGNFGDTLRNGVDAGLFTTTQNKAYDAGLFNSVKPPATGGGFDDKADAVTGGGFE